MKRKVEWVWVWDENQDVPDKRIIVKKNNNGSCRCVCNIDSDSYINGLNDYETLTWNHWKPITSELSLETLEKRITQMSEKIDSAVVVDKKEVKSCDTCKLYAIVCKQIVGTCCDSNKHQPKEPVQKYITVTDGFRGSLKRDFWVRDSESQAWVLITGCELIAREDSQSHPFRLLMDKDANGNIFKQLKFLPFTIENPPPSDWLAEVRSNNTRKFSYFKFSKLDGFYFYYNGNSSLTNTNPSAYLGKPIWLNIEEVE